MAKLLPLVIVILIGAILLMFGVAAVREYKDGRENPNQEDPAIIDIWKKLFGRDDKKDPAICTVNCFDKCTTSVKGPFETLVTTTDEPCLNSCNEEQQAAKCIK